jgi:hypothetical protein
VYAIAILLATSAAALGGEDQPTESVLAQSINIAADELGAKGACLNEKPLAVTTESMGRDSIGSLLGSAQAAPGYVAPYVWSASQTRKVLRNIRKAGLYGGARHRATDRRCEATINVEPPRVSNGLFSVRIALHVNSAIIQRAYVFSAENGHVTVVARTPEEIIVS